MECDWWLANWFSYISAHAELRGSHIAFHYDWNCRPSGHCGGGGVWSPQTTHALFAFSSLAKVYTFCQHKKTVSPEISIEKKNMRQSVNSRQSLGQVSEFQGNEWCDDIWADDPALSSIFLTSTSTECETSRGCWIPKYESDQTSARRKLKQNQRIDTKHITHFLHTCLVPGGQWKMRRSNPPTTEKKGHRGISAALSCGNSIPTNSIWGNFGNRFLWQLIRYNYNSITKRMLPTKRRMLAVFNAPQHVFSS